MIIMLNRCWILVMIMKILFSISLAAIQQQWEVYYDDDTVFRTTPTAFIYPSLPILILALNILSSDQHWLFPTWCQSIRQFLNETEYIMYFYFLFFPSWWKCWIVKLFLSQLLLCLKMFTTTIRMENRRM